jgi:hypothetical protein
MNARWLLLGVFALSLYGTGQVWLVQLSSYPLPRRGTIPRLSPSLVAQHLGRSFGAGSARFPWGLADAPGVGLVTAYSALLAWMLLRNLRPD